MQYHSKTLQQTFETRADDNGDMWVRFSDGVIYSPHETRLLNGVSDSLMRSVHLSKQLLGGKVIEYDHKRMGEK